MPELPEVETVAAALRRQLPGKRIAAVVTRCEKLRQPLPITALQKEVNSLICAIRRRAKYLLIDLNSGRTLIIHLGMSGTLRLVSENEPAQRHDHLDIKFADGTVLRYRDPRRFGLILLATPGASGEIAELGELAPEPLSAEFNAEYLFSLSRKRTTPIKNFIMDQRRVVGVGNIYASESLFRSRICPTCKTGRLTLRQCRLLVATIKEVLSEAITAGGTTIADFHGVDGSEGAFFRKLLVYGQAGEPCPECGAVIEKIVLGGRSTFYCPKCQK